MQVAGSGNRASAAIIIASKVVRRRNVKKTPKLKIGYADGSTEHEEMPKIQQGLKKTRSNENYIEKKISPSIMSQVIAGLSDNQRQWVRVTGFAELLNFRMLCYTHRLGYNVVNAFDSKKCSLELRAGSIQIDDKMVEKVIGLPRGDKEIIFSDNSSLMSEWSDQFPECKRCKIKPRMVKDKILASRLDDKQFKLNFLVLFYNFFIECNQNQYLVRDVLNVKMDIDNCGEYNWCQLLIDKLKKTHAFWAANRTRNFKGALAFLIVRLSSVLFFGLFST